MLLVLLLTSGFASAQDLQDKDYYESLEAYFANDTVKPKRGEIIQEITVQGNGQKYPRSVVKSGIQVMDLPQAIQVIDGAVIEKQQLVRLSEVIKNANGVYVSSARGGTQESFFSRGYDLSTNNLFKNGFRTSGGAIPEVSSLDKVEILKGSSALLYGNVAPGGIVNLVTKTPLFNHGGSITMQAGSFDFYKPTLDIYGPLNSSIAYRLISSYENSGSFRDNVERQRLYVNPSFLFRLSPKTELTVIADYLYDDFTPDFGTGAIGKELVKNPRNLYLGALWSTGLTKQTTVSTQLTHKFNDRWKLGFASQFQDYHRTYKGTERIQPSANGDWARPLGQSDIAERIAGTQLNIQGNFNTGKIGHQFFAGADSDNSFGESRSFKFDPAIYDTINIINPNLERQRMDIPNSALTKIVKTEPNRAGIFAQDLVTIIPQIKVLAGIRWSWQETKPVTYDISKSSETQEKTQVDVAYSPKAGLIFTPSKTTTLFATYANSFLVNSGTTVTNEALKPSIIDQFEVGLKKQFWKNKFMAGITAYQIMNSTLAQMAEFNAEGTINTDSSIKILSGETKSKGIEVDFSANPVAGLSILFGYSYNDMRFTKTSGLKGSYIEGDRLVRTPVNTANASFFYTFEKGKFKGFNFGAASSYIGDRLGGWNNTNGQTIPDRGIPVEGYVTVDVSAGYEFKHFSLLCKLSNVTNEFNYTVHENYSVNPIAPRQILGSIKYRF